MEYTLIPLMKTPSITTWWRYTLIPLDEGPHHPYQLITKNATIWRPRENKKTSQNTLLLYLKILTIFSKWETPNSYEMREYSNQELLTSLHNKSLTFQSLQRLIINAHMPCLNRHLPPKMLQLPFNKHLISHQNTTKYPTNIKYKIFNSHPNTTKHPTNIKYMT